MNAQSNPFSFLLPLLACLFLPGLVVVGVVYWIGRARKKALGAAQRLGFEAVSCTQTPDGNILVSPNRESGILTILLSLLLAALGLWGLTTDPIRLDSTAPRWHLSPASNVVAGLRSGHIGHRPLRPCALAPLRLPFLCVHLSLMEQDW